jgi:fructose-1,6-bisphosphatase/inositol monophosphatase family enzyme
MESPSIEKMKVNANKIESVLFAAGRELLQYRPIVSRNRDTVGQGFETSHLEIETKVDGTLVSKADHAAQRIIFGGLGELFPHYPIYSEEGTYLRGSVTEDASSVDSKVSLIADNGFYEDSSYGSGSSWILDPLDGTKEFLSGGPDFAVQLGLCESGKVVAGWVYFPALSILINSFKGERSLYQGRPLTVLDRDTLEPSRVLVRGAVCPRGLATHPIIETQVALRRLLVGELDAVIIRLGRLGVWDVVAWALIVEQAGGVVCAPDGSEIDFHGASVSSQTILFTVPSLFKDIREIANTITDG